MRDEARKLAGITGGPVHISVPSWLEPVTHTDTFVIFPPDRRPTRLLLGQNGKVKDVKTPSGVVQNFEKRVAHEDFGTEAKDFRMATAALLSSLNTALSNHIVKNSPAMESRYLSSWKNPKTFDQAVAGKPNHSEALRKWHLAEEVRLDG